jgi:2-oxoisovalerate dehydrogenase E1 component
VNAGNDLAMYRRMLLIRRFETTVSELYRSGEVPGFVHLSLGQEAVAVGACSALDGSDIITSTHRGHAHCLAKGLSPAAMFAELMGRQAGTNRGRGGSMHIADPELGIFGANGIVAAGLPIASGAAAASWLRGRQRVVVSFFGDGAVAHGAFHEAVNLAALWQLPVIFCCENNGFAEFSPADRQHPVGLASRSVAYGLPFFNVDGNDVGAVAQLFHKLVGDIRDGHGPALVEAITYRWSGHYEGDPQRYRAATELAQWQAERDPVARQRERLVSGGERPADLEAIEQDVEDEIGRAVAWARQTPEPDPGELEAYVYRQPVVPEPGAAAARPAADGPTFRVMDAIHDALAMSLENDPDVFLAGIDIGVGGNVFGLTRGLQERWPRRVLDTPISETAIVGLAVGAAMAGLRPVVELMYLDFIGVCFDQIINQSAKLGFMTGGKASMALTIRTQFGVGRSSGAQHSQSLEALLAHIPGLKVVMPADPADYYGLLRASILDPDPVVFIENRLSYGLRGPRPEPDYLVPIGVARVARAGSDVTIVAWSAMVHEALAAAEELMAEGVDAEVIDLRTVAPIDFATIRQSVAKTSRLLIAQQAVRQHGLGAEIAARMCVDGFWDLDVPIARLGGPFTPVPYSPGLEQAWLPDRSSIAGTVRQMMLF